MSDEQALLARIKVFDMEALAEVYDTFSPAIYRHAYRLVGDARLAEDCTTETFSRLLKALKEGNGPASYLKAYLFRIAHNWVTDHYRRGGQAASLDELAEEDGFEPAADVETPQQLAEAAYDAAHVRRALAMLTPDQRAVIVMKYFEEMSNEEIAAAVAKPVGAVKSLQHRALGALRRALAGAIEVS